MSSTFHSDELSLAFINAMVNGSVSMNPIAALEAWNNRTDETAIGVCGLPCMGDCQTCMQSEEQLRAFFAPEVAAPPVEPDAVIICVSEASASAEGPTDEQWEELQLVARARDEADETARTGIWADNGQDYDGPDRYDPADDEDEDDYDENASYYDDRQDPYYEDEGYGLDWNESGYFD